MIDSDNQPIIWGAGLSGLIAARMLADRSPCIYEAQASLPNNHGALLRFREDEVSRVTNIPFSRVKVIKDVFAPINKASDAARYSLKVTGGYANRSIQDLEPVQRYIAPDDFIERLSRTADISYGMDFLGWSSNLIRNKRPILSTIPMPYMMKLFKWPNPPAFSYVEGWTIKARVSDDVPCDLNVTLYFPGDEPFYRASITGRRIMIEGLGSAHDIEGQVGHVARLACSALGIRVDHITSVTVKPAKYQKIADLPFSERESAKRFVMWLSNEHNIHSLGRFATWRPKLLLDDIPNDVRIITQLIDGRAKYEAAQ
jgi:hypothetical protein